MGMTKAGAYREAYDVTSKATLASEPYKLANNPAVAQEIDAIQRAIAAQEWQKPHALRALVVSSLVRVITDPESKPQQVVNAAKALGQVSDVGAFVQRSEVRMITSSEDARARVLEQLRSIVKAEATDAQAIEHDAASLLAELEPHRGAGDQTEQAESQEYVHTIPHEQTPISSDQTPTPSIQKDPSL